MSPIISVENLSKAYRIGAKEEVPDTIVGAAKGILKAPFKNLSRLRGLDTSASGDAGSGSESDILWALKDVSFEVNEGDVVGIIGRNGAGKSTLLKVLSRITEPTSGRAVIRGRVSSLLEVGTGFHPELTGRENVYMNGTILGMTKKEIDKKFDEIVDFSGVEKFLDTPTKRYSSGMQVRLAFAVAAHLEPEVLVVDEVLAVGDMEFQRKCLGKMKSVANGGRTVLFVSHNMVAVRELCSRGVELQKGGVRVDGSVDQAVSNYLRVSNDSLSGTWRRTSELGDEKVLIEQINAHYDPGLSELTVDVCFRSLVTHHDAFAAVDIFDFGGTWLMQCLPTLKPYLVFCRDPSTFLFKISLPPLIPGEYAVGVWIGESLSSTLAVEREAVSFRVEHSPTPGRTEPHSTARGYIVPTAAIEVDFASVDVEPL